jgi:hypothetical protein
MPSIVTANIVDNRDATVTLLRRPLDWRLRAVEEIVIDSATSCLRRRSLQATPLRPLLDPYLPVDATHALVALHVAAMPRGPLLDFDVSGPDGPAWLLPRTDIALRQSLLLKALALEAGVQIPSAPMALLAAILGFTGESLANPGLRTLDDFVNLGLGRDVAHETVERWREVGDGCRELLRPRLDRFDEYSAPENPAIVLPELFETGTVASDDEATTLLTDYLAILETLDDVSNPQDPNAADEFLNALADYGNYYDLIVAIRVPLDEPFLVKYSERRNLSLSAIRNKGSQELVIADARTNHVSVKVLDPSTRLCDEFEARTPDSKGYTFGAFEPRKSEQYLAFYAHDPNRDYRTRLHFRVALLRRVAFAPYFVSLILVLLAAGLVREGVGDLGSLALVAGPAALAVSVLVVREPTTLGSRLRLVASLSLTGALVLVLDVAVSLYLATPVSP